MNNEIKEILDYLKDDNWDYYPSDGIPYKVFLMEERDKLLDYITNLQQENERLKELKENVSKVCMAEHRYGVDKAEEARDYKSRCEKAIEYIKLGKTFDNEVIRKVVDKIQNDLLNILQNGSEEK